MCDEDDSPLLLQSFVEEKASCGEKRSRGTEKENTHSNSQMPQISNDIEAMLWAVFLSTCPTHVLLLLDTQKINRFLLSDDYTTQCDAAEEATQTHPVQYT